MDVWEKLVELLAGCPCESDCEGMVGSCPHRKNGNCNEIFKLSYCAVSKLAQHLITNGVTVQEWISVKEHLPQENEPEGATCEQVQVLLNNGVVSTGWCNRHTKLWWHLNYGETHFIGYDYEHTPVVAWQSLAQPTKGE